MFFNATKFLSISKSLYLFFCQIGFLFCHTRSLHVTITSDAEPGSFHHETQLERNHSCHAACFRGLQLSAVYYGLFV